MAKWSGTQNFLDPFLARNLGMESTDFSQFTGIGGPMKTGQPDRVKMATNPYGADIAGAPEMAGLRSAMQQRVAGQAGNAREQALMGQNRAGVSSADSSRQMGDIATQQAAALQAGEAAIGQQDFENRMSLMNAMNAARKNEYAQALAEYEAELKNRGAMNQILGGAGGSALGSIMGSK